jgi:SAM-dependent methyltransferase
LRDELGVGAETTVVYSDVDAEADVDIYCDAHDLPFKDECFGAIVTTAVLEHVMYPEQVAGELHRVLRTGGLIYSEVPFMQQVHEGAYDFTRYTLSGHRRLLDRFREIEAGMVAGPATALVWSVENFFLAFAESRALRMAIKATVRLGIGWLKHIDRFAAHRPAAMDAASCTYFYGKKIEGQVDPRVIISSYVGAKHLEHL